MADSAALLGSRHSHVATMAFRLLALLLFVLTTTAADAQPTVRAAIDADSVTVGQRFTLTLTARHADTTQTHFPDPARGDTLLGDLTVIKRTAVTTEGKETKRLDQARYEVTTFALDTAYVPPLPVRIAGNGDTTLALSSMLAIPVQSLVHENASDIRSLAPLATFPHPWWFWVIVIAAPLLLVAFLFYWWQRRDHEEQEEPPPPARTSPTLSPYDAATRRLRKLEQDTNWKDPNERKPFYVELSNLARTYLHRRLGVASLESTTSELMQQLERQVKLERMPPSARRRLHRLLKKADQVKFANRRPTATISKKLLSTTREAIDEIEDFRRTDQQPSTSQNATSAPNETIR